MVASLPEPPEIERHRAAIVRTDISRPVRMAIEAEILTTDKTFLTTVAVTVEILNAP